MKRASILNERQRFSIRKYSFGAASVLIGASLFFGGQALADEQAVPAGQPQDQTVQTTVADQPVQDGNSAVSPADVGDPAGPSDKLPLPQDGQASVQTVSETSDVVPTDAVTATAAPARVDTATQTDAMLAQPAVQSTVRVTAQQSESSAPAQASPAVTRASVATTVQAVGKDIPNSGYYTYPERTEVKNSPSASAPLAFYANAGDRVYYDQVLTQDGYQWLSYKSYSGIRRYANIAKLEVKEVPAPKTDGQSAGDSETTFPTLQRYTFDREVSVKNEARAAAKTEFTFTKGEGVNYDKELKADGYKWISYVSYSGIRRYVMLDKLPNSQPSESKRTGQISVENQTSQGFDVRISNVSDSKGILAVKVPIWTDRNDQDDIIWYDGVKQGDGTYKVAVKLSDHKNETGTYNIHLYYVETDGAMKGVAAQQVKVAEPQITRTGSLSFSNKDNGDFDVIVSNVTDSQGLKAVKVPVWTDRNDQDDIIWYDGVKQADGTYKVTVRVSDHKNETGLYNIHLYYLENDGKLVGITGQQHRSETKKMDKQVTGTLAIQNQTSDGFDVLITNVSNSDGIVAVKVPVWTSNRDQDDIIWYDASKQADNSYKVTVKLSEHQYETGTYMVHLYYVDNNNQLVGVTGTTYEVPANENREQVTVTTTYKGTGNYLITAHNVPSNGDILVAVWSDTHDQDDIIWYEMNRSNLEASLQVNTQNHNGTGTYHAHVYQRLGDKMTALAGYDFQVNKSNYDTPYYNQRDGRWSGLKYGRGYLGPTGCVPTDLAMVISSLKGQEVTPNQVADYLYNNTNEFNKNFDGTSGQGILQAASHWGLVATPLGSLGQVQTALSQGYHVLAAVQNSVFVRNGSHELVLKGYNNGSTHVSDPYTSGLSGWYSVSQLWNEQSHDPIDTSGIGAPFIKITDA
ncbi:GBS Bsp-like repeat-containing protein [Streptococcus tangpeifui]|uniref:GBS Bsp-like repeat-containing protein n=1 Tax=Streptococcus tangpeifui TaxID=2709400 RepID=UPI0013ECABCB|nr:GBS Bsp-like repeat-containing protein [Streptococcus sp. ZJ1593]